MEDPLSTQERVTRELSSIRKDLFAELEKHFVGNGKTIDRFEFLDEHLSPVRVQGGMSTCSFLHVAACTEMVHRICGRDIDGPYLDAQECFDNIFKKCDSLPYEVLDANERLRDTMAKGGTEMGLVLGYVERIGLLPHSACVKIEERNLKSVFDESSQRYKIDGHRLLQRGQVLQILDNYPIVAVLVGYASLAECNQVVYDGPEDDEVAKFRTHPQLHAALLVGKFELRTKEGANEQYVIIQNSDGVDFGFKGFKCMRFDDIFKEFWIPVLSLEMDHLTGKKDKKGGPPTVGSKRKRKRKRCRGRR